MGKTESDENEEAMSPGRHNDTNPHIVKNVLQQTNTEVKPSFRRRSNCFGGLLHTERKTQKSKMKTDRLDAIHELIRARHARFEKIARRVEEESEMLDTCQTDRQANHLCGDTFQTKTEADKTEEALILGKHKDTTLHIVNNGLRQANTEVKPSFRGRSHCFGGLLHNERRTLKTKANLDQLDAMHALIKTRHARFEEIARRVQEEFGRLDLRRREGEDKPQSNVDNFLTITEFNENEEASNAEAKPNFRARTPPTWSGHAGWITNPITMKDSKRADLLKMKNAFEEVKCRLQEDAKRLEEELNIAVAASVEKETKASMDEALPPNKHNGAPEIDEGRESQSAGIEQEKTIWVVGGADIDGICANEGIDAKSEKLANLMSEARTEEVQRGKQQKNKNKKQKKQKRKQQQKQLNNCVLEIGCHIEK